MILLDTCALLWLVSDQTQLSEPSKRAIAANAGNLFLSSISAFEIAIKVRNGHLTLPISTEEWIEDAIQLHGIEEIPINSSVSTRSVLLPQLHKDPCDRFIIATAQIYHLNILTKDRMIPKYPDIQVVW
jgi:PIN domain nuclease of toxin-antitoxin system